MPKTRDWDYRNHRASWRCLVRQAKRAGHKRPRLIVRLCLMSTGLSANKFWLYSLGPVSRVWIPGCKIDMPLKKATLE